MSTEDVRLKPLTFFGRTTTTPCPIAEFDNELHFLISADNLVATRDTANGRERFVNRSSYRGMSGSPVFAVDGDPFQTNWKPVDTKIIGIQSSFFTLERGPDSYSFMKVCRIEKVWSVVKAVFPNVLK